METFRADYAKLKASWLQAAQAAQSDSAADAPAHAAQFRGYDEWVAQANNASLGAQAAYDELVPEFEALFMKSARQPGPPWQRFYDAVRQLADLPKTQRRQALKDQTRQHLTNKEETSGG